MEEQYINNLGVIKAPVYQKLMDQHVLICGLGGLGGYIAHVLIRMGIKTMTLVDFDVFDLSNMNRQMYAYQSTIGCKKVECVKKNLLTINPNAIIHTFSDAIEDIDSQHFSGIDVIFDAVDQIKTKCYMDYLKFSLNIPLIHGAIGGWFGQIACIEPHVLMLEAFYDTQDKGLEETLLSPSFTPGVVSHMMVNQWVKWFIDPKLVLLNEMIFIDLLHMRIDSI